MIEELASQSVKTPAVTFDPSAQVLRIIGKSYPEDLYAFWQPVIDRVNVLMAKQGETFSFDFELTYHNSGSARVIINFIKEAERIAQTNGKRISVIWRFDPEDEQSMEQGEDYQDLCNLVHFELRPEDSST